MRASSLPRVDAFSRLVLLLWAGAALGFGLFFAPVLFQDLTSRDLAGQIAGRAIGRLDLAAWLAFGLAGLSWGGRWVAEIEDDLLGPTRLWSAAWLVALLMCLASTFVVTPKIHAIRARINAPIENLAPDQPARQAYNKAHALSRNLFFLRILLAIGLATTVTLLPTRQEGEPEA
jgi:hypothetical protein